MKLKLQLSAMLSAILLLVGGMATTAFSSAPQREGGPLTDFLVFKLGNQPELWTMLKNGEIDLLCAPLTKVQYEEAINDPNIQLAPFCMSDINGVAINNNRTIPSYPDWRSPTNYTEFRKAIEYCIDKDGFISSVLKGFATRIDTPVPRPNMEYWAYLNQTVYDPAAAARFLDEAGFVEGYEDNPYYDPNIPWSSPKLRVYPPGHEKEGQTLDPLIGYARVDHEPQLILAKQLTDHLRKLGIPVDLHEATISIIYWKVFVYRDYHFYTDAWDLAVERFPLHLGWYMSSNIHNYINFRDPEYDYWAGRLINATSLSMALEAALKCQEILLDKVASVWVWSSISWEAYRKGWLHMVNMRGGYGLNNQWTYLFAYNENPNVNTLRVGIPPVPGFGLNPIYDPPNEILESVFGHLMYINPYKPTIPGQSPGGGDQPWLAKDWTYEIDRSNKSHVVFWVESGVVWHDGTPFTAFDIDYTIWLIKSDPSSWYYPYVEHVERTIVYDNYKIEIIFDNPSMWNIYNIGLWIYIVPSHADFSIGAGAWKYSPAIPPPNTYVLEANRRFILDPCIGDIDLVYKWDVGVPPRGGCYKVGLSDLVMLARAYGSRGNPPTRGWEPGCDIAPPSCIISLADLVMLAHYYGKTWGHYDP